MKPALLTGALAVAAVATVAPVVQAVKLPDGLTPEDRAHAKAGSVEAIAGAIRESEIVLGKRTSPSGTYAPANISCPQLNTTGATYVGFIRNASGFQLNPAEDTYIRNHRAARQSDWNTWLKQSQIGLDSDVPGGFDNYTSDQSRVPTVGIAFSGGGYRAMLNGAGVFAGLDGRNDTAKQIGTGGLVQLADYLVGLSGGSWLTGSVAINDYPTTQQLIDEIWNLDSNLVLPDSGKISFYSSLIHDVNQKKDFVGNGYWTGITDYWARALSYHLINNTKYPEHGINVTWGDVRNVSRFQDFTYPYPIIVADEREPNSLNINGTSSIWEFTPYEYGTWERRVSGFIDIDLVGTPMSNGQPENNTCVGGWSNAGWVMGTSSTLFNGAFIQITESKGGGLIKKAVEAILGEIGEAENDVSLVPNAFDQFNTELSPISATSNVTHVDGGEDGQNVPIWPLINPGRKVDFIIAEDASNDVSAWPNGTSIRTTAARFNASNAEDFDGYSFPYVPPQATFVNRGLNTRPTFFGCPGSHIINENSSFNQQPTPIVAYLPTYPYSGWGNTSTYKLEYSQTEAQTVLDNAFDVATMGNATSGEIHWPTCLACGILTRSFQRSHTPIPDKCQTCLKHYCWDGVENNTEVSQAYSPPMGPSVFITSGGKNLTSPPYTGGNGSSNESPTNANPGSIALPSALKTSMAAGAVGVVLAALV